MKPTAVLITTSRGNMIDERDLQFIWQGSDSIAAPLVLDLVRLTEFASARVRRGR